ncbi:MAG: hypothetical protein Q9169_001010 [Polycauliona sp. 2 TL-2023]
MSQQAWQPSVKHSPEGHPTTDCWRPFPLVAYYTDGKVNSQHVFDFNNGRFCRPQLPAPQRASPCSLALIDGHSYIGCVGPLAMASSSSQEKPSVRAELHSNSRLRLPLVVHTLQPVNEARTGHFTLDTFSPVNQNGSFEFDRVLKSGEVYKRTRKTKQWKKLYLVLRPNLLSAYKTSSEDRLHKQISLSDLNAVALVRDRKGRREHLFGLYTPARNYHFQAKDERDAKAWVELIRQEARLDQEEEHLYNPSPLQINDDRALQLGPQLVEQDRFASSSPEPIDVPTVLSTTRDGIKIPGARRPSAHNLDYSGDDFGPQSDWSDAPPATGSLVHHKLRPPSSFDSASILPLPQGTARNASQSGGLNIQDDERVVWHGYLLILKSKGGVRQWKRLWAVLRPKNVAFYKNEEEYAAQLIIPLSNIINAVEIDPVSRSKPHCMQLIAEDKNFRLCAPDEEALAKWLGAFNSQLARRREKRKSTTL